MSPARTKPSFRMEENFGAGGSLSCCADMSTSSRIAPFGNLTKSALEQLEASGFDKRRRTLLEGELTSLGEDDEF